MKKVIVTGILGFCLGYFVCYLIEKNKKNNVELECDEKDIEQKDETILKNIKLEDLHNFNENFLKNNNYGINENEFNKKFKENIERFPNEINKNIFEENDKKSNYDITVIPPDEFGVYEEYNIVNLTYFNDDVLINDSTMKVLLPSDRELVGDDFIDSFGEWDDEAVYVRNDSIKTYFEIVKDPMDYEELEESNDEDYMFDDYYEDN